MSAEHYRDDRPARLAAMPAPTHTPPCDDLAEECLISSVLIDPTGSGVAVAGQCGVKATSFYNPAHVLMWTVLEQLLKERCPVSVDMLATRLTEQGELEKVGGYPKLLQATGRLATSLELRHYAELVVNYWRRRHGLKLGAQLAEISAATEDREEFARECGKLGQRLITISQRTDTHTLADTITAVRTDMQLRAAGKEDRSKWVFTGLKTFDQRLKPLNSAREDGLTVVGGGSGEGKSALMRQWAKHALDSRQKVVFFNRETSTDGCIEQMASLASGLDLLQPERALRETIEKFDHECERMSAEWADKYLFCYQHTAAMPLFTIEDLELRARQHSWTYGAPDLVVVDYLQLFGTVKRGVNKREEVVAHVSHCLQSLQRELGCAVLVAAQLNESGLKEMRQVRRDDNEKVIHRLPGPGDFRESQAIYHDADRVIAIYRPPVDSRDQDQTGPNILKPEQWLCQIKRRKGGTGVVRCRFEKQQTRFVELPDFATSGTGQTKGQFLGESK